jgi:hypothetical protein
MQISDVYAALADLVRNMLGAVANAPWPLQLSLVAFIAINAFVIVRVPTRTLSSSTDSL